MDLFQFKLHTRFLGARMISHLTVGPQHEEELSAYSSIRPSYQSLNDERLHTSFLIYSVVRIGGCLSEHVTVYGYEGG